MAEWLACLQLGSDIRVSHPIKFLITLVSTQAVIIHTTAYVFVLNQNYTSDMRHSLSLSPSIQCSNQVISEFSFQTVSHCV